MEDTCKVCGSCAVDYLKKEFSIFGLATYKKCTNCHFLYSNHIERSAQSLISEHYKKQSFENNDPGYRARAKTALASLLSFCKINRIDPKNISLLDYGSGAGEFLLLCKKLGMQVTGFEPFYTDANLDKSLNIVSTYDDLIKLKTTFDFVCCFEVIEHLTSPQIFEDLLNFLKPNGNFFFSTGMYIHDLHTVHWEYLVPEHCSIYSVNSLETISKKLLVKNKYIIREPFRDVKYLFTGEVWSKNKLSKTNSLTSENVTKLDKIYWKLFYLTKGKFYKFLFRIIYSKYFVFR